MRVISFLKILGVNAVQITWCAMVLGAPVISLSPSPSPSPLPFASISTLMKPALWKRMVDDRELMVHAKLESMEGSDEKKYSFYTAMLVGASVTQTRQILTDYKLYAEMVPYVDKAQYSGEDRILSLEGGIWSFKIQSELQFDEPKDRWIHYRIIEGSFKGLTGDIFFESLGERGTAVYLQGWQTGKRWPPEFVIERGAEIVFGFAANRMRSYIESQKNKMGKGTGYEEQRQRLRQSGEIIPEPRSHL